LDEVYNLRGVTTIRSFMHNRRSWMRYTI